MQSIKKSDFELLSEAYGDVATGVRYGVVRPKPLLSVKAPPNELVGKWLDPIIGSLVVYAGKGQLDRMLPDIDLLIKSLNELRDNVANAKQSSSSEPKVTSGGRVPLKPTDPRDEYRPEIR